MELFKLTKGYYKIKYKGFFNAIDWVTVRKPKQPQKQNVLKKNAKKYFERKEVISFQ